jgi:hypothetical protein
MLMFSQKGDRTNGSPKRRRMMQISALLIVCTMFVSVTGYEFFGKASTAKAASWTETWNDEFDGAAGSAPNGANWLYDTGTSYPGGAGNWGTGEVETNTNSTDNVYLDGNGHLAIKPINNNGNWTSGRIETQSSAFAAPAGGELAVEASIQVPNVTGAAALGYWPAFWMLGSAFRGVYTNWPTAGEVDTMENINGLNTEYGTLHCGVDPGGPCNETTGLGGNTPCSGSTCQSAFHTYRVEIDRSTSPEQIRWYLDGNQFWQVSSNAPGMDPTTWANAVDHSFFIILNVAIGGGFPNAICGCSSPSSATASGIPMLVDYVRAYTSGGNGGGGTTGGGGTGPYYKLVNRNSGQDLDISGGSTANGGAAIQWPDDGGANQQWQEVAVNGGYKLVNRNSGLLLDDPGYATTPGTALDQWSDSNSSNQWWNLVSTGDGYYYLVNQSSGLYADVSGASTANGASVIEWSGPGGINQEWQLVPV